MIVDTSSGFRMATRNFAFSRTASRNKKILKIKPK